MRALARNGVYFSSISWSCLACAMSSSAMRPSTRLSSTRLIQGQSGTGKELVAGAIQRLSARRDRPHQIVNCGAIPRELLFSELFGHERGAFTGAVGRKVGLLAVAAGGTLFLDEVGELPLEAQTMLLRFLQHGEVRRLGATETTRVDVRLISATHCNLNVAVERGAFRDDLSIACAAAC
jgi:two-component system, NtrC family, response regulator HydG